jgi:diguanylate cyclase (GGDEF)-like protein
MGRKMRGAGAGRKRRAQDDRADADLIRVRAARPGRNLPPDPDIASRKPADAALREVSRILKATLREEDIVARLGGDEFVVYAPGADALGTGGVIAARLAEAFAAANAAATTSGRPYELNAGIGVAMLQAGDTLDTLLAKADADLYAQKKANMIKTP